MFNKMDTFVFHIADIHIKNSRRDEYFCIIDKLVFDIANSRSGSSNKICLIVGDIFDGKISFSASNVLDFLDLIRKLCGVCDIVITMMGNHDINLNLEDSIDLIYPIWNAANISNWKHIKTTENITYNDICFNIQSPNEPINLLYGNAKYNVLAIHENIGGVEFGDTTLRGRVNVKELEKYDAIMAGHIHEMTPIGNNGAYCGALIQQNQGETITKGYLRWKFSSKEKHIEREFVPIHNKFGFLKITIVGDKITTNTIDGYNSNIEAPYKAIISVNNAVKDVYDSKIQEIKDTYKIQPETKNLNTVKIETENINESTEQIKLITKMLENNAVPEDIRQNILYMHKTCEKKYHTKYNWEILKLEWANLFCYNEGNVIDFTKIHDNIIGIISKNKSGKSSIVDILVYALFNETLRGTRFDIINKYRKEAYLKVKFKVDDDIHEINRDFYAGSQKILHIINGENKTGKDVVEVYKNIESIIGTYEDFISTVVMTQDKKNDYISMTRNEQVDFLSKLLGLDVLQNNLIMVREEKLKCKGGLVAISRKKEDVEKELADVKLKIDNNKREVCDINQFISLNSVQLIVPKIKSYDIKKEINKLEVEISKYNDITDSVESDYIELCKAISKPTEEEITMSKNKVVLPDEDLSDYKNHKFVSIEKITEILQKIPSEPVEDVKYVDLIKKRKSIKAEIQLLGNKIKSNQAEVKVLEEFILNNPIINKPNNDITDISSQVLKTEKELDALGNIQESAEEEYIQLCKMTPPAPTKHELELSKEKIPSDFTFDETLDDFNQIRISHVKLIKKIEKYKKLNLQSFDTLHSYFDIKKQKDKLKAIKKELDFHKANAKFINYYQYIDKIDEVKTCLNALKSIEILKSKKCKLRKAREIEHDILSVDLSSLDELNSIIEKNTPISKVIKNNMVFDDKCEKCCMNRELIHRPVDDILYTSLVDKRNRIVTLQNEFNQLKINKTIDTEIFKLNDNITIYLPISELQYIVDNINDIINEKKLISSDILTNEINRYRDLKYQLYLKLQQLYQQNIYKSIEICHKKVTDYENHMKILNEAETRLKSLKYARVLREKIEKLKETLSIATNEWDIYNKYLPILEKINENKEMIRNITQETTKFEENIAILTKECSKYKRYLYEKLQKVYLQNKSQEILHCIEKINKYNEYNDKIKIFEDKLNQLKQKRALLNILDMKKIVYKNSIKEELEYSINLPIYEKCEQLRKRLMVITDQLYELSKMEFSLQNLLNSIIKNENINKRLKILSEYEKCLNYKTGIPIQILQKASQNITNYTNNIIQSLSEFSIKFKLEGTKLNLYIVENGNDIPIELGSGFQKFIISLAMRQAFVQLTNKSMPKLLIIDEGFGCLDEDNLNKMVELIPSLKSMFKHIIIISHLDIIKNSIEYPLIIKQIKTDQPYSLIKYGDYTIKTKEDQRAEKIKQKKKPTILQENIIINQENEFYCNVCESEYKNKYKTRHISSKSHITNLNKYDIQMI